MTGAYMGTCEFPHDNRIVWPPTPLIVFVRQDKKKEKWLAYLQSRQTERNGYIVSQVSEKVLIIINNKKKHTWTVLAQ